MTIDWPAVFDLIGVVMMVAAAITTFISYRSQRKHHRLIDVRMMFMDLWGSGTYEFIRTGKGWHGIGHRYDGDTIEVPWSGK